MEKTKKILYILTTILEISLLIVAYMFNYFTKKKMGMSRHVISKNYVWENTYPIINIQYATITALIILMILVLIVYMKRKKNFKKIVTIMSITMVIFVLLFTGFTLIYSTKEIRAFYYIDFIFGLITLIQIIKTFIGVMWCKDEK
jgi:hypothetical protein